MSYTGNDLIAWGFEPGPWFQRAIRVANHLAEEEHNKTEIIEHLKGIQPAPPVEPLDHPVLWSSFALANNDDEYDNLGAVHGTMHEVMRTPHVEAGAIMPDACPAGPMGNIPVGGVVASPNIHPGMHSADVCCSVACTVIDAPASQVLNVASRITHFGRGPRTVAPAVSPSDVSLELAQAFQDNPFLQGLADDAWDYLATQGDGNHFLFVGTNNAGETCLVTHHGSRKPGAELYKRGMRCAEQYRKRLSPNTPKANAWIPAGTADAVQYWNALQAIRQWTQANHFLIHDMVVNSFEPGCFIDRFWNEHNFVFQHEGLFYHAKGATPMWHPNLVDDTDIFLDHHRLIPLNMSEPVLVVGRSSEAPESALGFAPHGAGRNFSRTQHRKRGGGDVEAETAGIDMRWYSGKPDTGELPSAYKSAATVRRQIESMGLARVVDEIRPYGCIMAGEA